MQTTVWTQEMINDRFLPLQSLQRASQIELIQKTEFFSLYIQGSVDLNTSLQYLTATYFTSSHHFFPQVSSQALFERLLFLSESEQRHHLEHCGSVPLRCLQNLRKHFRQTLRVIKYD